MPGPLKGSVVVLTGASSGIGRAAALAFARRGAIVVAAARREQALLEVAEECRRLAGDALAVPTDVSDRSSVRNLVDQTIAKFGRIDVWVNDAGVYLLGRIEDVPWDDYRQVLETNLFGTIHGARAVIPYFRRQGSGVLINVASIVGRVGQPYTSAYVASKFGVVGLSESLRAELLDAPDVHVCTVLPDATDTPIFHQAGNYTGRAIKAPDPVYDPEDVAQLIVRCAENPKREVYATTHAAFQSFMHALMPGTAEKQAAAHVEAEHFDRAPASSTSGNLHRPMPEHTQIRGGWQEREESSLTTPLTLAGAALVGLGLVALWRRSSAPGTASAALPDQKGQAIGRAAAGRMPVEV